MAVMTVEKSVSNANYPLSKNFNQLQLVEFSNSNSNFHRTEHYVSIFWAHDLIEYQYYSLY